jgi:hypothetical protein
MVIQRGSCVVPLSVPAGAVFVLTGANPADMFVGEMEDLGVRIPRAATS